MKNFKKLLGLFIVVAFMVLSLGTVNAADQTVTFDHRSLNGVAKYPGLSTSYKTVKISTGEWRVAYCLNLGLSAPEVGAQLKLDKEITDAKLVYLLNNGYGGTWNDSVLGSNYTGDEKYYVTQIAIWIAQGSLSISQIDTTGHIGSAVLKLINAANKFSLTTPTLGITGGGNMTISSDGNYYVSPTMKLSGQGYNKATITLVNAPADAKIVVDGQQNSNGVKVDLGKQFYISIPVSKVNADMTMTVKVSSSGSTNKVYRYTAGSSKYQNIALMYVNSVPLSASTTISVAPRGSLRITKVDNSTGTEVKLSNVKLTVKNAAGAVVASWTTNDSNNPYIINNLPIGTYTIIEESAPAGYIKSSDINVTTQPGKTIDVKVVNSKTPSKVKISKQDITTKAEIAGAHLVLKDALGKVVDEWVSTTSPHYIQSLTPGRYTLSETVAPEGYLLSTETVTFTVEKDGGVEKPVVMYNTPIPDNTYIEISKRDITNDKELPGAKLTVKDANGNIIDEWISTTTPHLLKDLKEGKYTLIETQSPDGYGISDEIIEFEVAADGGVKKTVIMYNSPIPVTADMNITLIVAGLIGTIGLAGFSIFKLNKQAS